MEQYRDTDFTDNRAIWPFLKRIFSHAYSYKKWFWGFIASVAVVAFFDATLPLVWLHFIDDVLTPSIEEYSKTGVLNVDVAGIRKFSLIYVGLSVMVVLAVYAFIYFAGRIQEYVMYDLRKAMFNKLQHLSFSYYDKSAIGWLISRITQDADKVTELISWGFLSLVWGTFMIAGISIAMMIYSWKLALLVLVTIPFLVFLSVKIRVLILKYARQARRLNSEITANFNENIDGIEVNKSTAQEAKASERFQKLSEKMRNSSFRASYYTAMYLPLVVMIGSVAAVLVIYFGGHLTLMAVGGITLGTLAAFYSYSRSIFEPIFDITRFYAMAQSSLSAGERIFSLMDEEEKINQDDSLPAYDRIAGDITFENVDFYYVEGKQVLEGFNLDIKAGESIALVGPSGEGKSTIANLICRFYEPVGGSLKIDGIDYKENSLHSLRSQLGVILQQPHLFSGTIMQNIKYGNMEATNEEIERALKFLGAESFIGRLDEEVGEEGSNLSTGEKQIISFARTLIKDPRILVLDEATSSIDTIAEAQIQNGIDYMIKGRTSIIIAHRLSTIKNCDRILVIQKGKIAEAGNHRELMDLQGHYYQLYMNQVRRNIAA